MKEIDLGVNQSDRFGGLGVPEPSSPMMSKQIEYPRLHLSGSKMLELPEEGMMEVKFRKVSESSSKRQDGSNWYECCLEVKCICEVEGDEPKAPSSRDRSAEDALDILAKAVQSRRSAEVEGDDED
jgi:hypothetical protein